MRAGVRCRRSKPVMSRRRSRRRPTTPCAPWRPAQEIVVGVNAFQQEEPVTLERLEVDPAIEQAQRARLQAVRARRDQTRVDALCARLAAEARGSGNLVPVFIECVEHDVTLGEICGVLRDVWGEYRPATWI